MGEGAVTRNSGNVIGGEWCPGSLDERTITVWHGDLQLRSLTPSIEIKGSQSFGFSFELNPDLIVMLPPGRLSVRDAAGRELPERLDAPAQIIGSSLDGGAEVREKLAAGYFIDKWGALKLPFAADAQNRREHRDAMARVVAYFRDALGIAIFPHYGTLLGLARGGTFLDHDDDVDMSFYVQADSLDAVVQRYLEVVARVEGDGHQVGSPSFGQFHVRLAGFEELPMIDIFLSWGTTPLEFNTYFGVAGSLSAPLRLEPAELEGETVLAPAQIEEVLALTYGPSWRIPDPTFQWRNSDAVGLVMYHLEQAATRAGHPPTHALEA